MDSSEKKNQDRTVSEREKQISPDDTPARVATSTQDVNSDSLHHALPLQPRLGTGWVDYDETTAPQQVKDIIDHGDWAYLNSEALRYKNLSQPSSANSCSVDLLRFARGVFNAVFELSFSDDTFWVVRVAFGCKGKDNDAEIKMLSEIATMRLVSQNTSIPVASVFGYDFKVRNPFGFRYMFMSFLPGKPMKGPLAFTVPENFRLKVAAQMASCVQQLSTITFAQIGQVWTGQNLDNPPEIVAFQLSRAYLGPFNSSRAYFAGIQQEVNEMIFEDHGGDDDWSTWLQCCNIYSAAAPLLVLPELRRGPFPLYHPDFHFKNILFDDDFNITGVLDWTSARSVPWENFILVGDVIPFDHFAEGPKKTINKFRRLFVDALRQIEKPLSSREKGPAVLLSDMVASPLLELAHLRSSGISNISSHASRKALRILVRLFGSGTTFENYKERRRRLGQANVYPPPLKPSTRGRKAGN